MLRRIVCSKVWGVLLLHLAGMVARAEDAAARLPIPAAGDLLRARQFVGDHDFPEWCRDDLDAFNEAPSRYLLRAAAQTGRDPTLLFARLEEARRFAWEEGRPEEIREATAQLADKFQVDQEVLLAWDVFRAAVDEPVLDDREAYLQRWKELDANVDAAIAAKQLFLALEMSEANCDFCARSKDNALHASAVAKRRHTNRLLEQHPLGFELPDGWKWRPREKLLPFSEEERGTRAYRALAASLAWLAIHQCVDGSWDSRYVQDQCSNENCLHVRENLGLIEPTALALLAYLGAGQTHKGKGPYRETINAAVERLLAAQFGHGGFRMNDEREVTAQALAVFALSELHRQSEDDRLPPAVERGAAFLCGLQNPKTGGWGEQPQGPDDSVTTAWAILAIYSAGEVSDVDFDAFSRADRWWQATRDEQSGWYSRQPGQPTSQLATAAGTLAYDLHSLDYESDFASKGRAEIFKNAAAIASSQDMEKLFFASMFGHRFSKTHPEDWSDFLNATRKSLIESQQRAGCAVGSWSPRRGPDFAKFRARDRVETTALATLTLEIYYKCLKVFTDMHE